MHYEVEFGVVIGKHGKSIPEAKALSYVGGTFHIDTLCTVQTQLNGCFILAVM